MRSWGRPSAGDAAWRIATRLLLAVTAATLGTSDASAQTGQGGAVRQTRVVDMGEALGGGSLAAPANGRQWRLAQQPEIVRPAYPAPAGAAQPQPPEAGPAAPRGAFGPEQFRLPLLSDADNPLGMTPRPTPETVAQYRQFIDTIVDPENVLDLVKGRPRLVIFREPPLRVQVANPDVANFDLISDREFSVTGYEVGRTVLNLWFRDPANPNQARILSYLVTVIDDPEARQRLERAYKALEAEINRTFPNSWVQLSLLGDKLVVRGEAKDVVEAAQIMRIARANAPRRDARVAAGRGEPTTSVNVTSLGGRDLTTLAGVPDLDPYVAALDVYQPVGASGEQDDANIINLLRVPGEQQVMLRVTVAEVNRSAARSIGLNFSISNDEGLDIFSQLSGSIGGTANLPSLLDNGQVRLAIRALRNLNLARSLAEPNLVTLNGQPAAFRAGGQFPVPSGVASFGAAAQGVAFVPFGVSLRFVPMITDRDRVRLDVTATVSTRDESLATNIGGSAAAGGTNVAGLQSRSFFTTVELREGQTLAVAGLIQNNFGSNSQRVPLWGDIPLLGLTGGSSDTSADEQELVILVTPELVHPLEGCQTPPLPGADMFEPGDVEFYLLNRLESRRSYDFRSPARTDFHRIKAYEHCEDPFIIGPMGQSYGCCNPAGGGVPCR